MPRKSFVGGNWKCNGTTASVKDLCAMLKKGELDCSKCDVVVAPSALHIALAQTELAGTGICIATQNLSKTKAGAFTGEHTAEMVKDIGLDWTVLGHSERRHKYGETDEDLATKVELSLQAGLKVIFCIGELLEERESGRTIEVCKQQMLAVIPKIPADQWENLVIAYEPVWAIGTGKVATTEQAQEAHAAVRQVVADAVSQEVADSVRILYGGSVTSDNSSELIACPDVDGFLVGGASLKPQFVDIVKSTM